MLYLRPCFYKYLNEEQRPQNWEQYAEEDQKLYDKEQSEKKMDPKPAKAPSSNGNGCASPASSRMSESNSNIPDGDETEEEDSAVAEPLAKKVRVD
jgi:hypothetical protein